MTFVKATPITLKEVNLDERWLHNIIKEDPSILGLGDLELRDFERIQPKAGRLDLILYDPDNEIRYEVEVMLGRLDESHIIRTIEYWDIERKRYPKYEHRAVIVAEDITSRFLNILQLFNNAIPLIAIQLNAAKIGEQITLTFNTVLDITAIGEEEPEIAPKANRGDWERKASTESLKITDDCLAILREIDPELSISYTQYYIGLTKQGRPNNFVLFRPKRTFLRVEAKLSDMEYFKSQLEEKNVEIVSMDKGESRIKFRLDRAEVSKNHDILKQLFETAYKEWNELTS